MPSPSLPHPARTRGHRSLRTALLSLPALCAPALALAQEQNADVVVLDSIVITAAGFEQNIKEAPASISVITSEELKKGSFTSLTDALKEVQGVVTTGVANETDIYIRGLPGQYTLILVDGKRQTTRDARVNGNSGFEQSFIPPIAAIERIEIVRGPMSSLYGSDAMGGVINIITKPVADTWTGSITAETVIQDEKGFENSQQTSFYASGPLIANTLGLQVWGRKFDQDASSISGGPGGSDDYDLGARLTWHVNDQNQVLLEAGRTRISAEDYGDLGYRDHDRDHWSLTHKGDYGDLSTEFSFSQEVGERTTYSRATPDAAFTRNLRSPEVRNTVLDAKATRSLSWNGEHRLTFGGQFLRTDITDQNPGATAPGATPRDEKFRGDEWSLYVEDEWRMRDDFALTLGLRYTNNEFYGGHIAPRIYGVWNATENLTVKGGISTGYKTPELRSIIPGYAYTSGGAGCASNTPPSCAVILGNPDLKPEKTLNFELAAVYEADTFTVSATAFHTKFEDKLQQRSLGRDTNGDGILDEYDYWTDGPQYVGSDGQLYYRRIIQNFNVDEAEISGVELAGDWNITPDLSARASYTYTKSEQKTGDFAGFPLARTPEHMASLRFDWVTPVEGLDTWLSANYHGSEIASGLRIGSNGREVEINGQKGRKYSPYTTVDIGANYQLTETAALNAAVYNVFNEEVRESDFNTVLEGRRLWLGLTASF
ncbi:TonB-dependent receptor domain-containing protein [Paracoccus sp. J56]|uniref:TonB-dependent receptor domain-containing protein n=1 Tax=Paracoccus sp. J56 TaxID=935850 RepID=UPI000A0BD345|nr:TonB-dependent receptor [Paracoccus sp. J56]SMG09039.1 outer membrane receptor for ferrienterochelin and colicins [Paracoccus sp. J56]